jgi:hypothetical protein
VNYCHKIISLLEILQLLLHTFVTLALARHGPARIATGILPIPLLNIELSYLAISCLPVPYQIQRPVPGILPAQSRPGTRLDKIPLIPHLCLRPFDKHPLDTLSLAKLAKPMLTTQKRNMTLNSSIYTTQVLTHLSQASSLRQIDQ